MSQDSKKELAAKEAFEMIRANLMKESVIGIGTGSTANFFIEELNRANIHIKGVVCSSDESERLVNDAYDIFSLNDVHGMDFYIDGADEFNDRKELIKGGGGALTREKILAQSSKKFICIVDDTKRVPLLGKFPLAVEVIEVARSAISRELMIMGGRPVYRQGFRTDNGNQIIDVHNMPIDVPYELEGKINNIPGVVENGIFSKRKADTIVCASANSIDII